MPVSAIIPPDTVFAGGVRCGGKEIKIGHNFLTGNAAKKRETIVTNVQEWLDHRGDGYVNINDLPPDDIDHPDHPQHPGYPVLTEHLGIADDGSSAEITVRDPVFIWDDGPNRKFLVFRSIWYKVELTVPNDPVLGGNDRYVQTFTRTT